MIQYHEPNPLSAVLLALLVACGTSSSSDETGHDASHGGVDATVDGAVPGEVEVDGGGAGGVDGAMTEEVDGATTGEVDGGHRGLPLPTVEFETSYSSFSDAFAITGVEPAVSGAYPLFIYVVGTNGQYDAEHAQVWLDFMAPRGFVAATVDYTNGLFTGCGTLQSRAAAIFEDLPDTAAGVLCARPNTDCSKGIVVAGHSQGSLIALLANDHNSEVRGAVPTGSGYRLLGARPNFENCIVTERVLPNEAIRVVTGASDPVWGNSETKAEQLDAMTGMSCGFDDACVDEEDGHGWFLVPDSEVADGDADHCFFSDATSSDGEDSCQQPIDPAWLMPSTRWGLPAAAEFLISRTSP